MSRGTATKNALSVGSSPSPSPSLAPSPSPPSPALFTSTSGSVSASCSAVEFGKSFHATGICFLDHMVDQLTSHAQIGVTMRVSTTDSNNATHAHQPRVDYAGGSLSSTDRVHDEDIFAACGAALGSALKALHVGGSGNGNCSSAVFCCPLDEAFAEARLSLTADHSHNKTPPYSSLCELAPYGAIPKLTGRRWIGCYRCALTPVFFESLAKALGGTLELRKVRGRNAHHVVESSFKAFARAFRACLDNVGVDEGGNSSGYCTTNRLANTSTTNTNDNDNGTNTNNNGTNNTATPPRTATRCRSTKETTIEVQVHLDKPAPATINESIHTGVEIMDLVLGELRQAAGFHITVKCDGDIYIDDHHTVEDVAITLGQCLNKALGDKAGLARMGVAEAHCNNKKVRCVADLSNRPYFEWDLPLDEEYVGGDREAFAAMRRGQQARNDGTTNTMLCGSALTCEMLQHVFESLTIETRATVHVELLGDWNDTLNTEGYTKDLAVATARAYGAALRECVRVDPRRAGKVASSKGTLSV